MADTRLDTSPRSISTIIGIRFGDCKGVAGIEDCGLCCAGLLIRPVFGGDAPG